MATAEEGGAAVKTNSSSYVGGGAGGKFRKKPFHRQTTPYDRPLTALRGSNINNNNNSSWLTKLVVEPASKLISYGADCFFASVLRRRLPPPPPPQPPEVNADVSNEDQVAGLNDGQDCAQEPRGDDSRQPTNSSSSNVVLELEQLLKQKTFTRSEIVHLTELLQSRAVEVPLENASQKNQETASDFGRRLEFASDLLEGDRNGGIRSSVGVSTPVHNSKVLEDNTASAEVAKAYMGSRASKVSPSELGMLSQLGREGAGLLNTMPFASKLPIMSMTKKTSFNLGTPVNGFITPRSRSRSAIYNMARTPYSRVHPTSILKGSGINNNGHAGQSTSSPLSLLGNNEKFESQPVTLKRRSSVLDDEGGSVGPIRRIRQKSNLLGPKLHHTAHGVQIGPPSKQKPELSGEKRNKALKNIVENENESVASISYARVHSRSSEVGARILQQLEDLISKEKSSESKLVSSRGKSPLKSSPAMTSGSGKEVASSKLLLDVHSDDKFGDRTKAMLPDAHDSSPEKQGKVKESEPKTLVVSSGSWNTVLSNDSAVSLKASDSAVNNGASQPPQKMRAFRMSAEEDSMEQDDVQCNGLGSGSLSEKKGSMGSAHMDSNLAPAEPYELVKPTIESKDKSPFSLISSRTNEVSPGAIKVGEGTSSVTVPASEETKTTLQLEAFTSFDKPKEANNPAPLFSFSSKVADKFPSLPAESFKRAEPEAGRSSSSDNISISIGSEVKALESDIGSHLSLPKPGDINGKCDDVSSSALDGPLSSSASPVSFPAASSRDANQVSTGSASLFAPSTSITNSAPAGSIFGLATKPSCPAGPSFKFGSSVDSSTAASPASTTEVEINPSSGSSSSSVSSGSSIFGLSSFSNSAGNNLQGSLFASAIKPPVSETVSQGTSTQLFSSTLAPAFNVNTSSPLPTFGFNSSASSSGPTPVGGPTSSLFNISASSVASSSSSSVPSTVFASTWQTQKSPIFSSTLTPPSPSTGFAFGGPSTSTSCPVFSFTSSSASALSTPLLPITQPVFGNTPNDQLNAEDSMAEDPAPSSAPGPVFGQPSVSPSPPGFGFGSTAPSQANPFIFGGQQNQVATQNPSPSPSPFQATGSLEFSAGGGFSLGSRGGDKLGRKIVKVNRNKNWNK